MTWVLLHESGIAYSEFTQSGATFINSVAEAVELAPSLDGTLVLISFSDGNEFQSNLNLGWTGRVRMTVQSYHAVSPGDGADFEASEMAQRAFGDALVARIINDQPPYPELTWTSDDVTSFTPGEFIGDVFAEMTYLDDTWVGATQVFAMRTASMSTISYSVLFEAEMSAIPSGNFWTNLVNVRES